LGIVMAMVFCRGCGASIHDTAETCPSCGAPQRLAKIERKSQTVAGLWCFFLGGFGAHRFYLGKTGTAIVSLLFFWTFIPLAIACIDIFIIAFSSQDNWSSKYNNGIITNKAHWTVKLLAFLSPFAFLFSVAAAFV
jgi:TM2 domain-containing membrane protein YozV